MRLPDFVNVTASELFDCSLPLQTRPDFELEWPKKREAEFVVGTTLLTCQMRLVLRNQYMIVGIIE
jgi:hypothetical protein